MSGRIHAAGYVESNGGIVLGLAFITSFAIVLVADVQALVGAILMLVLVLVFGMSVLYQIVILLMFLICPRQLETETYAEYYLKHISGVGEIFSIDELRTVVTQIRSLRAAETTQAPARTAGPSTLLIGTSRHIGIPMYSQPHSQPYGQPNGGSSSGIPGSMRIGNSHSGPSAYSSQPRPLTFSDIVPHMVPVSPAHQWRPMPNAVMPPPQPPPATITVNIVSHFEALPSIILIRRMMLCIFSTWLLFSIGHTMVFLWTTAIQSKTIALTTLYSFDPSSADGLYYTHLIWIHLKLMFMAVTSHAFQSYETIFPIHPALRTTVAVVSCLYYLVVGTTAILLIWWTRSYRTLEYEYLMRSRGQSLPQVSETATTRVQQLLLYPMLIRATMWFYRPLTWFPPGLVGSLAFGLFAAFSAISDVNVYAGAVLYTALFVVYTLYAWIAVVELFAKSFSTGVAVPSSFSVKSRLRALLLFVQLTLVIFVWFFAFFMLIIICAPLSMRASTADTREYIYYSHLNATESRAMTLLRMVLFTINLFGVNAYGPYATRHIASQIAMLVAAPIHQLVVLVYIPMAFASIAYIED